MRNEVRGVNGRLGGEEGEGESGIRIIWRKDYRVQFATPSVTR
jgi:hypothetical protein